MNLRKILKQDEELGSNRSGDDGRAICWRMNERKIRPEELSEKTNYSLGYINEIIKGVPVRIELDFLQKCIIALQLSSALSGRSKDFEKTIKSLSYEDCMGLIKPPPAMPPRQGNFWEHEEDE